MKKIVLILVILLGINWLQAQIKAVNENGRAALSDLQIVKEEYRFVNGLKVLFLQMDGTMYGIKIFYYGYYFSNTEGTIQFVIYTAQNLLKEYQDECDKLLKGLVQTK
mgnify:CR=1 FL=1